MEEQGPNSNGLGVIASNMYRKIMQHGYIEEKKAPSKKKKKTKNPFQYDYQDEFIDDDELIGPKMQLEFKFQNFKALNYNVESFYNSQEYKKNLSQIIEFNQKKNNELQIEPELLEAIKKQMRENILKQRENLENKNQTNVDEKQNFKIQQKVEPNQNQLQKTMNSKQNSNEMRSTEVAKINQGKEEVFQGQSDQVKNNKSQLKTKPIKKSKPIDKAQKKLLPDQQKVQAGKEQLITTGLVHAEIQILKVDGKQEN